jgi:hypothetical protein
MIDTNGNVIDVEARIKHLENLGEIDSNCKMCQEIFYPAIKAGKMISNVFAPRHKASPRCESGKYAHCTCDTCF